MEATLSRADASKRLPGDSAELVRQIHSLVGDLQEPRLWIYWIDFLTTIAIAYGSFFCLAQFATGAAARVASFLAAGFAFYRAMTFIHELAHQHSPRFRWFRIAWNALCGIPLQTPSFVYGDHKAHHVRHSYGTARDAEYLPLATGSFRGVVGYFLQALIVPSLGAVRFLVLGPLSWFIPPLRRLVWERLSNIGNINFWHYRRAAPESDAERREALVQEVCCFVCAVGMLALPYFGVIPWKFLHKFVLTVMFATVVNYVRALAAHRYLNDGAELNYSDQLLDSTTIPGHPLLTELWAPLGLRYHALHHTVPSIPYHNLGTAHRRLMAALPADSPYRATVCSGLVDALSALIRRTLRRTPKAVGGI